MYLNVDFSHTLVPIKVRSKRDLLKQHYYVTLTKNNCDLDSNAQLTLSINATRQSLLYTTLGFNFFQKSSPRKFNTRSDNHESAKRVESLHTQTNTVFLVVLFIKSDHRT